MNEKKNKTHRGVSIIGCVEIGNTKASRQEIKYSIAGEEKVMSFFTTSKAKAIIVIDEALDIVGASEVDGRMVFPHFDHFMLWAEYHLRGEAMKQVFDKGWHVINGSMAKAGLIEIDANGHTIREKKGI